LPTPIEHLALAQQILTSPALPAAVRTRLDRDPAVRGAFFFGHIAPDVQVVSRQPRESTHFFRVPPTNSRPGYLHMLDRHPWMRRPGRLAEAHAAFLTGYISHLLLDEVWVREIFRPIFGPEQTWGDWHERLLLHNVLRAWLDRRDLRQLGAGLGVLLRGARPDCWLPFASDGDLRRWRDLVAEQFEPGAPVRTVEIFARRSEVPPEEFLALLDPDVMRARIFTHVAPARLEQFYHQALAETLDLTRRYWAGCLGAESE
jgi:hypothetical protein